MRGREHPLLADDRGAANVTRFLGGLVEIMPRHLPREFVRLGVDAADNLRRLLQATFLAEHKGGHREQNGTQDQLIHCVLLLWSTIKKINLWSSQRRLYIVMATATPADMMPRYSLEIHAR